MILILKLEQPDWFGTVVGMDCFGWLWVVVLCSWLVRASAMIGMGRKVLNDLERVSPIMLEMGWLDFFFLWGPFFQYSLSWPYLWQEQRTQGKERPPALLWSELLKKERLIHHKL